MKQYFKTTIDTYFGGKGGSFRHIINQVPPHEIKIIPFLGNCAITRHMRPAPIANILFELDSSVFHDWVRANVNTPFKLEIHKKSCLPFLDPLLWFYADEYKTFTYIDPPYHPCTRTSNNTYNFEMTEEEHRQLLEKVKSLPGYVAVSHYPCKLYDNALSEWRFIEYESMTRGGTTRTERLYMNYPPPTELHDYSFYGKDYREREKFKRRAKTVFNKIEKMNPLERHKLFENLVKNYPKILGHNLHR